MTGGKGTDAAGTGEERTMTGLDALIGVLLLTGLDGVLLRAGETPQERVSAGG